MTPAELKELVECMREMGVTKLKTAEVELELGTPAPPSPAKTQDEDRFKGLRQGFASRKYSHEDLMLWSTNEELPSVIEAEKAARIAATQEK